MIGVYNPGHPDFLGMFCLKMEESIEPFKPIELKEKQQFRGLMTFKDSRRIVYEIRMLITEIKGNVIKGKLGLNTIECSTSFSRSAAGNWLYTQFKGELGNEGTLISNINIISEKNRYFGNGGFNLSTIGNSCFGMLKTPMAVLFLEPTKLN